LKKIEGAILLESTTLWVGKRLIKGRLGRSPAYLLKKGERRGETLQKRFKRNQGKKRRIGGGARSSKKFCGMLLDITKRPNGLRY